MNTVTVDNVILEEKKKAEKTRTSFYIDKDTQDSLKKVADSFEISQGDIINLAPSLFNRIAQRSLERRERSLATLKTLENQIQASIEAMKSVAPHLSGFLYCPADFISRLVNMEETAVRNKVISGLGVDTDDMEKDQSIPLHITWVFQLSPVSEPAYQRDLDELMGGK